MSMSPSAIEPNADEDAVFEAELQVELEQLNISDDEDNDLVAEDVIQFNDVVPIEEETSDSDHPQDVPQELQNYFETLKKQTDAFERELEECDSVLEHKPVVQECQMLVLWEDVQIFENAARELGLTSDQYKQKILKEIEEDDMCDIEDNDDDENNVERGENVFCTETELQTAILNSETDGFTLKPGEGIVAVIDETAKLEKEFRKQMKQLNEKHRKEEQDEKEVFEKRKREEEELKKEAEEIRKQKILQLQEEEQKLVQENLVKTQQLKEEQEKIQRQLAKNIEDHEEKIKLLTAVTQKEKQDYERRKKEEDAAKHEKEMKAVLKIQSTYRGHRVRKTTTDQLKEKKVERLKKKEEERIKEIEMVIDKRKEEEERVKAAERQRKLEEERKKEEEKLKKQEEERKRKEEEQKKIEEQKRREDEKKRKEEEKRREEEQKKEEERLRMEKKKLEEERKREEERIRIEEEKREKERLEKIKQEVEMRKEKERLEKQRELQRIEDEKQRVEEERKKEEIERKEKERLEEEKTRLEEQEEQKKEEEKRKLELCTEAKSDKRTENKLNEKKINTIKKCLQNDTGVKDYLENDSENIGKATNDTGNKISAATAALLVNTLPSHIECKRLKWIKECLPWSKVSNEPWKLKAASTKKPPRRPSSAKKLEILPENVMLAAAASETLRQVTTLELKDLPGYNLSSLSQCWGLKSLSMNNCNLIAADGFVSCKHLQYLNLQNNHLEYVDLKDLGNLQVVDLSHNKLSVIHGFAGCTNVRWLDLSHNKITRIGALESLRRLHTLNVSHNHLITTKGLDEAPTIQVLNLSKNHLQKIDDIEKLCLLQKLEAPFNNLTQFPDLVNHVLLFHLDLHDNSITSLDAVTMCWLPLLTYLNISENSLEEIQALEDCISLKQLHFYQNQLDSITVTEVLKKFHFLEKISMRDNPGLNESEIRDCLSGSLSRLLQIDDDIIKTLTDKESLEKPRTSFEAMCLSQIKTVSDMFNEFESHVKSANSSTFCDVIFRFCEQTFNLAVEYRYAHEYGEVSIKIPSAPQTPKTGPSKSVRKVVQKQEAFSNPKDMFEKALKKTDSQQAPKPTDLDKGQMLSISTDCSESKSDAAATNSLHQSSKVNGGLLSNNNAQMFDDDTVLRELHVAATKIQALWRGYRFRCKLFAALEFAKIEDDDDFCFEDLDAELLNFDESKLDTDWEPPAVPQIPQKYPVLGLPPTGQKRNNEIPPLNLKTGHPHPPKHPVQAWQNMDSPMTDFSASQDMRVPRPPSSVQSTALDTERTYASKREEKISEEWGFKDTKTAELMMQRAKKMKYNALKKKKLSKLDPKQRFALFQKLEGTANKPTPAVNRKMLPRKEYFQARQEAIELETRNKAEERTTKINRTYEWIHTNIGDHEVTSSRINQKLSRADFYGSESNLPKLDADVRSGGRVKLMASPVSCDIESVSTFNSRTKLRRYSVGSKDSSASTLPAIKSGSVPVQKKGEKMSWRSDVKISGGWGGGRKRPN